MPGLADRPPCSPALIVCPQDQDLEPVRPALAPVGPAQYPRSIHFPSKLSSVRGADPPSSTDVFPRRMCSPWPWVSTTPRLWGEQRTRVLINSKCKSTSGPCPALHQLQVYKLSTSKPLLPSGLRQHFYFYISLSS